MGCRYGSVVTDSACLPPGHYPEAAGGGQEPRLPAQPCLQPQRSPTEVSHLGGGGSVLEVLEGYILPHGFLLGLLLRQLLLARMHT